jgi:hypothetical protein
MVTLEDVRAAAERIGAYVVADALGAVGGAFGVV